MGNNPMKTQQPVMARKAPEPSDFASFVTITGGKSHSIQMQPTASREVQIIGQKGVRDVAIPNSGKRIRFQGGTYTTNKQDEIDFLLTCDEFGTAFGIDPSDPTGYWQKNAEKYGLEVNVLKPTVVVSAGPKTVVGPLSNLAVAGAV